MPFKLGLDDVNEAIHGVEEQIMMATSGESANASPSRLAVLEENLGELENELKAQSLGKGKESRDEIKEQMATLHSQEAIAPLLIRLHRLQSMLQALIHWESHPTRNKPPIDQVNEFREQFNESVKDNPTGDRISEEALDPDSAEPQRRITEEELAQTGIDWAETKNVIDSFIAGNLSESLLEDLASENGYSADLSELLYFTMERTVSYEERTGSDEKIRLSRFNKYDDITNPNLCLIVLINTLRKDRKEKIPKLLEEIQEEDARVIEDYQQILEPISRHLSLKSLLNTLIYITSEDAAAALPTEVREHIQQVLLNEYQDRYREAERTRKDLLSSLEIYSLIDYFMEFVEGISKKRENKTDYKLESVEQCLIKDFLKSLDKILTDVGYLVLGYLKPGILDDMVATISDLVFHDLLKLDADTDLKYMRRLLNYSSEDDTFISRVAPCFDKLYRKQTKAEFSKGIIHSFQDSARLYSREKLILEFLAKNALEDKGTSDDILARVLIIQLLDRLFSNRIQPEAIERFSEYFILITVDDEQSHLIIRNLSTMGYADKFDLRAHAECYYPAYSAAFLHLKLDEFLHMLNDGFLALDILRRLEADFLNHPDYHEKVESLSEVLWDLTFDSYANGSLGYSALRKELSFSKRGVSILQKVVESGGNDFNKANKIISFSEKYWKDAFKTMNIDELCEIFPLSFYGASVIFHLESKYSDNSDISRKLKQLKKHFWTSALRKFSADELLELSYLPSPSGTEDILSILQEASATEATHQSKVDYILFSHSTYGDQFPGRLRSYRAIVPNSSQLTASPIQLLDEWKIKEILRIEEITTQSPDWYEEGTVIPFSYIQVIDDVIEYIRACHRDEALKARIVEVPGGKELLSERFLRNLILGKLKLVANIEPENAALQELPRADQSIDYVALLAPLESQIQLWHECCASEGSTYDSILRTENQCRLVLDILLERHLDGDAVNPNHMSRTRECVELADKVLGLFDRMHSIGPITGSNICVWHYLDALEQFSSDYTLTDKPKIIAHYAAMTLLIQRGALFTTDDFTTIEGFSFGSSPEGAELKSQLITNLRKAQFNAIKKSLTVRIPSEHTDETSHEIHPPIPQIENKLIQLLVGEKKYAELELKGTVPDDILSLEAEDMEKGLNTGEVGDLSPQLIFEDRVPELFPGADVFTDEQRAEFERLLTQYIEHRLTPLQQKLAAQQGQSAERTDEYITIAEEPSEPENTEQVSVVDSQRLFLMSHQASSPSSADHDKSSSPGPNTAHDPKKFYKK